MLLKFHVQKDWIKLYFDKNFHTLAKTMGNYCTVVKTI